MNIDFHDCLVPYNNHGVMFLYPDIWQLDEETDGEGVIITVSAPGPRFWTLRILLSSPAPPQAVESCVAAFQDEYEDAEVENVSTMLAEMPACARDVTFFCMELLNTAALRSVRTSDFTLLVWWQATSNELDELRPMLDEMTESVRATALMD
ncbi:MAG TPA: hypothetical protein EYG03_13585 [Planctomycetes bacterium]|nr:hypothetical protein [Fuerstiella sp.]HIK92994.1 hypothetical protein [Planctomycetota bacterium]